MVFIANYLLKICVHSMLYAYIINTYVSTQTYSTLTRHILASYMVEIFIRSKKFAVREFTSYVLVITIVANKNLYKRYCNHNVAKVTNPCSSVIV